MYRGKNRRHFSAFLTFILILSFLFQSPSLRAHAEGGETPSISYSGHMQSYGTLTQVKDGETLGKVGSGKRLEAFSITSDIPLRYRAHVQTFGWQGWVKNGKQAGTSGKSKRLEAFQIELDASYAELYDIYYRSHMANGDWLGWAKNGEISGTVGCASMLDGIQILLVKKGSAKPSGSGPACLQAGVDDAVVYSGHAQGYGDLPAAKNGATLGVTGQSKRLEAIKISLPSGQMSGRISYRAHVQGQGWQDYCVDGALAGTTGMAKRMEAIEISLTGEYARYFDVYYRVHVQTYGWLDWAKNGTVAGTTGMKTRVEAIQIRLVAKGAAAPGKMNKPFIQSVYDKKGTDRTIRGIGRVDVWMGDSRMVGFGNIVLGYRDNFESYHSNIVARGSANSFWVNGEGYAQIRAVLDKKPDAVIVSNFGVNDINKVERYMEFYRRLRADYPNATICVMSVNPIGPTYRGNNTTPESFNNSIRFFNTYMKQNVYTFDGYFIDTSNGLNPPTGPDGLHYNNAALWDIYHYVTGF